MNLLRRSAWCLWLAVVCSAAVAGAAETPFHGSFSREPAQRWEDAFVTGNGRMGAMWFGNPTNETLVATRRLFLPLGNREIVPDMAK